MKYAFIESQEALHMVVNLCRVLQVSRSGYYAWKRRPVSESIQKDQALLAQIRTIHEGSRQAYGYVKTCKALNREGVTCAKHRGLPGPDHG